MDTRKAALHNLGCKVNAYETEAMRQMLTEAGYEIVDFSERADVYVVNTCTVTNVADKKSRQMLRRARRANPDAAVVAVGCYAQEKGDALYGDVDIVLGNNQKGELCDAIEAFFDKKEKGRAVLEIGGETAYEPLCMTKAAEHTRAFVKVQDGCNQFCSYCIIPYARGRVRSRAFSDALDEIRALAGNGCKEVVLSGIHLSSYGTDIGESLLRLIQETAKVDGICRIRLGSLEPGVVTEEFAREIAGIESVCPQFHLSLQSGCDATLKRMNRRYTALEYERSCGFLRKYFLHPAITTDVIVGFPGETEEEFAATEAFLRHIRFYEMHIFKYSRRDGTKAAQMPQQVPEPIKSMRSRELISLSERMSEEFREYYVGKEVEALLEEPFVWEGERYFSGYTKEYVKVAVKAEGELANTLVRGRVSRRLSSDAYLIV